MGGSSQRAMRKAGRAVEFRAVETEGGSISQPGGPCKWPDFAIAYRNASRTEIVAKDNAVPDTSVAAQNWVCP